MQNLERILMGIFSKNKSMLSPSWQFNVEGQIWRLLPAAQGYLIGEERNASTMSVSFFCLEQQAGKVRWDKFQLDEKWWVGLEGIHGKIVFLHGYASPDWPVHKRVVAIDVATGTLRWMNDEVRFLFASGDAVYAVKEAFEELIFVKLDIATGSILEEVPRDQINVLQSAVQPETVTDLFYPAKGSEQLMEKLKTADVITSDGVEKAISYMESIESENNIAIAYYQNITTIETTPVYRLSIVIIDQTNNRVLYHDVMNAHSSVPYPETYFVMNGIIHYVKEKKSIMAIPFSERHT
jgi:hypothetical protein